MKKIGIIIFLEKEAMKGQKGKFITNLLNPLIYLLFLVVSIASMIDSEILYGGESISYISYCIPGVLCIYLVNFMSHSLFRTIIDKQWGTLGLKMLNGVSSLSYIIGASIIPYLLFLVQSFLVIMVSIVIFDTIFVWVDIILFVIVAYIIVLFWVSLGIILALLVKNYAQRDMIMSLIILPITFTAPIFYSASSVPNFINIVSKLNPMTYHVNLVRDLLLNGMPQNLFVSCLLTILVLCIGSSMISKAELEKQKG